MTAPRLILVAVAVAAALAAIAVAAAADASACTPAAHQRVRVALSLPDSQEVVSIVAALSYDPAIVTLPSSGPLGKRVTAVPAGAMVTPHSTPGTLRIITAKAGGLPADQSIDVEFDACAGRMMSSAALRCAIESCAGAGGPIPNCGCTVSVR